jgi:hypothetical protein
MILLASIRVAPVIAGSDVLGLIFLDEPTGRAK